MPRIAARILRTARAERRRIRDTREWQPLQLPPVRQPMHSYLAHAVAQRQARTLVRTWSKTPHHPPTLHHTWNNTQCPLHFLPVVSRTHRNRNQILLSSTGRVNPRQDNERAARIS